MIKKLCFQQNKRIIEKLQKKKFFLPICKRSIIVIIIIINEAETDSQNKENPVTIEGKRKKLREKQNNTIKTIKKDYNNKLKINIQNYLAKKLYKKRIRKYV